MSGGKPLSPYELLASFKKNSAPQGLNASSSPTPGHVGGAATAAQGQPSAGAPVPSPHTASATGGPAFQSPSAAGPVPSTAAHHGAVTPVQPATGGPSHSPAEEPVRQTGPLPPHPLGQAATKPQPAAAAAAAAGGGSGETSEQYLARVMAAAGVGGAVNEILANRERGKQERAARMARTRPAEAASEPAQAAVNPVQSAQPAVQAPLSTAPAPSMLAPAPAFASASSAATQAMRDQIARLLQDAQRRDEELEVERARAEEAERAAESWRLRHVRAFYSARC
jgi:hypothetical protein